MKKRLLILLITLFYLSCNNEKNKSEFIGSWSSTSDSFGEIDIIFYKDSMVIDENFIYGTYSNKWNIIDSKIHQNY